MAQAERQHVGCQWVIVATMNRIQTFAWDKFSVALTTAK